MSSRFNRLIANTGANSIVMTEPHTEHDESAGILYAGLAYAFWAFVPLYWRLLGDVPPFELTV